MSITVLKSGGRNLNIPRVERRSMNCTIEKEDECYNLHITRCYNMYTALLPGLVRLRQRLHCFQSQHKMHDSNEEKQKQFISLRNINATITALFTQALIVSKIKITPIKHAVTTNIFARLLVTYSSSDFSLHNFFRFCSSTPSKKVSKFH